MVFQAMAGRYQLADIVRHTFAGGSAHDTDRLQAALAQRYGVTPGDVVLYHKGRAALAEAVRLVTGGSGKVAVSGLTCYSVVQAVEAAGCTPIYIDIREADLQFGASELEGVLTRHSDISAVIVQNMLGIPADMSAIEQVAAAHKIQIIEDLAHSAGARYADGREVGTVGAVTMLSFGKDKALDVVNGGALIVRNGNATPRPTRLPSFGAQLRDRCYPAIAGLARLLYPIGLGRVLMGGAIRLGAVVRSADGAVDSGQALPSWQARLAHAQLVVLDQTVKQRQANAAVYATQLAIHMPALATRDGASLIRVPLLVDDPARVITALEARRIYASDVWYDVPVSPARYYTKLTYPKVDCPVAVRVSQRLVNLPTHQCVTPNDMNTAVAAVREVLA